MPNFFASTTTLRPSGVSSASDDNWAASASSFSVTPGAGMNSVASRLPSVMVPVLSSSNTSTSPAASTARPLIASTLCCSKRSMPAMPMALSRPPMVVGIRQTSSAISTGTENTAGIDAKGLQRHTDQQENHRQSRQQDGQRDFVRRLLALRAFHQGNHPVQKSFARIDGDADLDFVGEHRVPPVTALRSPPLSRITGADSPVMADSSTVAAPSMTSPSAGMVSVARTRTTSPLRSSVALTSSSCPFFRCGAFWSDAGFPQGLGLGFAAAFGHRLGKIGKQHGKPQPERQLRDEAAIGRAVKIPTVVSAAPTMVTNMTGFLIISRGLSFLESIHCRRPGDLPIKQRRRFLRHSAKARINQ
jgi:hypothetical protein